MPKGSNSRNFKYVSISSKSTISISWAQFDYFRDNTITAETGQLFRVENYRIYDISNKEIGLKIATMKVHFTLDT